MARKALMASEMSDVREPVESMGTTKKMYSELSVKEKDRLLKEIALKLRLVAPDA